MRSGQVKLGCQVELGQKGLEWVRQVWMGSDGLSCWPVEWSRIRIGLPVRSHYEGLVQVRTFVT